MTSKISHTVTLSHVTQRAFDINAITEVALNINPQCCTVCLFVCHNECLENLDGGTGSSYGAILFRMNYKGRFRCDFDMNTMGDTLELERLQCFSN